MDSETNAILRRRLIMRLIVLVTVVMLTLMTWYYRNERIQRLSRKRRLPIKYSLIRKRSCQLRYIKRLTEKNDTNTKNLLRMDRSAFRQFCDLLVKEGGLKPSTYVSIEEKVACFLVILGHHFKNRVIQFAFRRSGHTISRSFHHVLRSVLRCHDILVSRPEPVRADCIDDPWMHFEGCLGALDGTYIKVEVPVGQQPLYRNRKGQVAVNVLGVCDREMKFVYVLAGWEGSAADAKVLGDALDRENGFKVPAGSYYLVDAAYANTPGFLAPFRSTRYHLQEWGQGGLAPQNHKEYFNLKHSSARNIIERTFGLLKKRFGILRSPSFYPLKSQNDIILACTLVHNFLRNVSKDDLLADEVDELGGDLPEDLPADDDDDPVPHGGEANAAWKEKRQFMAHTMFVNWRAERNNRR